MSNTFLVAVYRCLLFLQSEFDVEVDLHDDPPKDVIPCQLHPEREAHDAQMVTFADRIRENHGALPLS